MRSSLVRVLAVACSLSEPVFAQIDLGSALPYGIIANTAITNTGATVINGRIALVNDATSITGFPPGLSNGVDAGNAAAGQARQDAQAAYDAAAGQTPTNQTGSELGGQFLVRGTYAISSSASITGTLVLDGNNDESSQFIFQIGSTLTTSTAASVVLINGAQACNVFWQVGSSATLGTGTTFAGNILALTSVSLNAGVNVDGGLYALNGAVTLINDLVTPQQDCLAQGPPPPVYVTTMGETSTASGESATTTSEGDAPDGSIEAYPGDESTTSVTTTTGGEPTGTASTTKGESTLTISTTAAMTVVSSTTPTASVPEPVSPTTIASSSSTVSVPAPASSGPSSVGPERSTSSGTSPSTPTSSTSGVSSTPPSGKPRSTTTSSSSIPASIRTSMSIVSSSTVVSAITASSTTSSGTSRSTTVSTIWSTALCPSRTRRTTTSFVTATTTTCPCRCSGVSTIGTTALGLSKARSATTKHVTTTLATCPPSPLMYCEEEDSCDDE